MRRGESEWVGLRERHEVKEEESCQCQANIWRTRDVLWRRRHFFRGPKGLASHTNFPPLRLRWRGLDGIGGERDRHGKLAEAGRRVPDRRLGVGVGGGAQRR